MAHTPPTLAQFRALFPEFADVADASVQFALDEATRFVTTQWIERDYQPAIMFLAAHFLFLAKLGADEITGGIGEDGTSSELVERLRSISYGPMAVGFTAKSQSQVGGGGAMGPGGSWSTMWSPYLERYYMYMPDSWAPIVLDGYPTSTRP